MTNEKLLQANAIRTRIENLRTFTNWNPKYGVSKIELTSMEENDEIILSEDSAMFIDSLVKDMRIKCIDEIVKLQNEFDSL